MLGHAPTSVPALAGIAVAHAKVACGLLDGHSARREVTATAADVERLAVRSVRGLGLVQSAPCLGAVAARARQWMQSHGHCELARYVPLQRHMHDPCHCRARCSIGSAVRDDTETPLDTLGGWLQVAEGGLRCVVNFSRPKIFTKFFGLPSSGCFCYSSLSMDTPPHTREPVHDLIAILLASGRFSDPEIAERCAVSVTLVATLRGSPLFQALVNGYKERFADKAVERVIEDIFNDTRANFEWLKGLRDHPDEIAYHDDPKMRRLQLRASEVLFERQVPKRAESRPADPLRSLGEAVVARLERAAAADDAVDVTPKEET